MCESWTKARKDGTDINEEYEAVIQEMDDRFYGGCYDRTDPYEYCPWCGKRLPDDEHE